jgi:HAD superfamily hydrolase (TIGR01549 family)
MKLIMFDVDGTLYRTETSFFPAVSDFAARYGFPAPDENFLRGFIGQNGREWRSWLEGLNLGKPVDQLAAEFDMIERERVAQGGELYPGTESVLRTLAEAGWVLGICSNASAWYPELILTKADVRDLFRIIRVPSHPDETKTMMLCEVWNETHPERCAMVGDRESDMQAAFAAGFAAIGASYGWAPEELGRADVRIDDIRELPAALERCWTPEVRAARRGAAAPASQPEPVAAAPVPAPAPAAQEPVQAAVVTAPPAPAVTPPEVAEEQAPAAAGPAGPPLEAPAAAPVSTPPAPAAAPTEAPKPVHVEPPASPSAGTHPAAPAAQPQPAPKPAPPAPRQEPPAPQRRSWNPFRRHDDNRE